MSVSSFIAFVAAALVVLLIPGPGVLYVVTRSVTQGRKAGLVSVLGLSTGALVHVGAATVGLSAILVASAALFAAVKLLGAGYLIYLGLRMLAAPRGSGEIQPATLLPYRRLFADGVIVAVFNPKVAVFFLAFLPQFVDPSKGPVAPQLLLLGLIYVELAIMTDGSYAMAASMVRPWLYRRMCGRIPQRVGGAIYVGLGIGTGLTGRQV